MIGKPGVLQSMRCEELDMTEHLNKAYCNELFQELERRHLSSFGGGDGLRKNSFQKGV